MSTIVASQPRRLRRLPWPVRSFAKGRRRAFRYAVAGLLLVVGVLIFEIYPRHPAAPSPIPSRFPQTTLAMRSPGRLRVLFLGNSLTQFNGGLAMVLEQLAASAKMQPTPVFDQLTKFGATWAQLWDVTKARDLIHEGGWDYVVLQDYSTAPLIFQSEMQVYGRRFSNAARSVGAKPVFFMTWPHADQPETLQPIAAAYVGEAKDNHGITAPVGWAWKTVQRDHPELILYDFREKPAKHPTAAGTYLTGCVFYSMFFNRSPVGLTGRIFEGTNVYIDLPPRDARILQNAAWQAVHDAGVLASTQPSLITPTTLTVKHATASR